MFKLSGFKAMYVAIFVATLALTACGQTPGYSQLAQQSVADPATSSIGSLIQGTYTTQVTGADLSPELSTSEEYLGNWQLKLGESGAYSTTRNGEVMSQGTYYFVNDELVFSESRYSRLCPTSEANLAGTSGTYDYSFEADGLTLKAVSEDCTGRSFLMQVHHLAAT